ncbi:site-2 protease family protein [Candidatus Hecatella orcuttiae]|jgi:membrane-associated protease RseP (regulator of RpoE activity)|uniref:site-2 protease family protein n=1 Tax=Candidatus Hecatella orcuttiae TaxID=1935119 RepID=UPI002867B4EF|nr:site-2 protease family protein [Candidatus Hecatella orcuttiae]
MSMNAGLTGQGNLLILLFLLAWLLIYSLGSRFRLRERGLDIKPFILILRTKKVNGLLELLAGKLRRPLPVMSNISLVLGVGLTAFATYIFVKNLYSFFFRVEEAFPIFPAVPVLTIRETLPYFLLSAGIIILVHEFAHGVVARHEKVDVKSAGIVLLGLIPGGFVEPDEESFKKAEREKKLRILAAGSSANLVFGLLMILLIVALFPPAGVMVNQVVEESPAAEAGLQAGDIIKSVNGVPTSHLEAFRREMEKVSVGSTVVLRVEFHNGTQADLAVATMGAEDDETRAIVGIYPSNYVRFMNYYWAVFWVQVWSINIAIFNMLPIYPLDGDGFFYHLAEKYVGQRARLLRVGLTGFYLLLLGLNITLTFMRFGFISI